MISHPPGLWTRSGQLRGPQGVDGKKSLNLWTETVTREVFEHRVTWVRPGWDGGTGSGVADGGVREGVGAVASGGAGP